MRVSEKIGLVDKIGRELQSRYTYKEIDAYLAEFDIPLLQHEPSTNSKWIYSKERLSGVSLDILEVIADEFEIDIAGKSTPLNLPPRNWEGTANFRLFISHLSKDKSIAIRLKECLQDYCISGFVGHEDIHPTLEWQGEIERSLDTMDAFLAIHTEGFSKSMWTQQEIGYALGKGVFIISFRMGEDPTGFISKHQALSRKGRPAEEIAIELDKLLSENERTKKQLAKAKVSLHG